MDKFRMAKIFRKQSPAIFLLFFALWILAPALLFAHCDTMDGPLIADAKKSLEQNNVNYSLKWVPAEQEKEIRDAFNLVTKVRVLSPEAKELADKYFFDTLVRVHRIAEGESFTGVKPHGTPIDRKLKAADQSLASGNLSPLKGMVPNDQLPELTKRFGKVQSLKNFDVDDVKAGRKYIEAYVQFFKFAEGESDAHGGAHGH